MSNKDRFALLNILDAIEKIKRYSEGYADADQLYSDSRSFDAAMMNFIIIGEMVARLSDALTEKNSGIDWFKIKGFRNIIAHDYFGVDGEEVWQIINDKLPELEIKIRVILSDEGTNEKDHEAE